MGGTTSPNLLPAALAEALSRARPNPLPANQVITGIADGDASVNVTDSVTTATYAQTGEVWGGTGFADPGWLWGVGAWN